MSLKKLLKDEIFSPNERSYFYIKERTEKNYFKKYLYNDKIEKNIKNKISKAKEKLIQKNCKYYMYIKNRTLTKDFKKLYYNEEFEKFCNFKDEIPEYYKKHREIKKLIKEKKYDVLINKLIDIEEISNKINNISKNLINNNILISKFLDILNDINSLIKEIDISNKKENKNIFSKIFGSNDKEDDLEDFVIKFKINKIKIDKKIELLNQYYVPNFEKELKERNEAIEELNNLLIIIEKKRRRIEKYLNNIKDENFIFEIKNKLQDILELENIIQMNIKSIQIDIENIKNYLSITRKLILITRNAINIAGLLFSNKKTNLSEVFNEPNIEKYLENIEEIKLLTDVKK